MAVTKSDIWVDIVTYVYNFVLSIFADVEDAFFFMGLC